jgi:NAD(P)-dependent dehydrogenase (short-subunit alcohol dehydrogenase family)
MGWTTNDIPDQTGRVAVVTGANGGLGFESAKALAANGAHVVMAARNQRKAEAARREITTLHPAASLELVPLDLASLASIGQASETIRSSHDRIDILLNNAGVMGIPERQTADGFEMQFGTNHLGHFVLTALLAPALSAADAARVVTVTSTARHFGKPVDPANPHLGGNYDPWRAYGQSKLANLYFALELQRRLEAGGSRAMSLVAHPGLSHTELQVVSVAETEGGASQRFWAFLARNLGMPPERGALPQLRAATDPAARGGELYAPRWVNSGPPVRRPLMGRSVDRETSRSLWEVSERETGLVFDPSGERTA